MVDGKARIRELAERFKAQLQQEHFLHELSSISILTVFSWGASAAMIFGGIVPYVPQYYDIYVSQNSTGFSIHVCLALLVANILRILFWFGHPFELPLLAQSVIMIFAMFGMLELCVRIRRENELTAKRRAFKDLEWKYFWNWTHFWDYVQFIALFVIAGAVLTYSFHTYSVYQETLGFISVLTEALLGVPQFYRNYKNRSTIGMSVKMVFMWFCGDTFKTGYFILRNSPMQFWICGSLQISIDILILCQVFFYKTRKSLVE